MTPSISPTTTRASTFSASSLASSGLRNVAPYARPSIVRRSTPGRPRPSRGILTPYYRARGDTVAQLTSSHSGPFFRIANGTLSLLPTPLAPAGEQSGRRQSAPAGNHLRGG